MYYSAYFYTVTGEADHFSNPALLFSPPHGPLAVSTFLPSHSLTAYLSLPLPMEGLAIQAKEEEEKEYR